METGIPRSVACILNRFVIPGPVRSLIFTVRRLLGELAFVRTCEFWRSIDESNNPLFGFDAVMEDAMMKNEKIKRKREDDPMLFKVASFKKKIIIT